MTEENKQEVKEEVKVKETVVEQKEVPLGFQQEIWYAVEQLKLANEDQFKGIQINTKLLWLTTTMATIAAINSIDGAAVFYKALVFMIIGMVGLVYSRMKPKEKQ